MRFIVSFLILLVLVVAGIWAFGEYQRNNQNNVEEQNQDQNQDDQNNDQGNEADKNIYETLSTDTNLKSIKALVDKTSLKDTVSGSDKFTLFIPSDEFLDESSKTEINRLLQVGSNVEIESFLKKHIVSGNYTTTQILELPVSEPLKNLEGNEMSFKVDNGVLFVNNVEAIQVDVIAKNGVVFLLKGMLK